MFVSIFVTVCLPILVLAAAGWISDRLFQLDLRSLVKLNIQLFVPAFLFVRLISSDLDPRAGLKVAGFTLTMIASLCGAAWLLSKAFGLSSAQRKSFQLATAFYNCGNFGIPLMLLAFPGTGATIQAFVLMTMNLTTFTAGVLLAHGETDGSTRPKWRSVLAQPSLFAISAALLCKATGSASLVTALVPVWKPLSVLADGLVPIALLTLGVQLSHAPALPLRGPLLAAVLIRLGAAPALAAVLVPAFAVPPETAAVLIAGSAAPVAVNAAMLVHEYGGTDGDSGFVSASVFYSTLLSALTMTIVLGLLKMAS
jgi:predicted permease